MVTSSAATGYVAKISMLRLNIGSGKLSSCMLSIGLGPKCEQGKGGAAPYGEGSRAMQAWGHLKRKKLLKMQGWL